MGDTFPPNNIKPTTGRETGSGLVAIPVLVYALDMCFSNNRLATEKHPASSIGLCKEKMNDLVVPLDGWTYCNLSSLQVPLLQPIYNSI